MVDDDHDGGESLRKMTKFVNQLIGRADSIPFREPVNWRELGLHDYPKIIKKMMDLGTVKRKLERGKYASASECADDIRLVWSNCQAYNADESDFFLLAETFSRRFEDRYRKLAAAEGATSKTEATSRQQQASLSSGRAKARSNSLSPSSGKSSPVKAQSSGKSEKGSTGSSQSSSGTDDVIPLDVRTRFAARLQRLSGMELGHVLQILELRCPEALEDPENPSPQLDETTVRRDRFYSWEEYDGGCELEINVDSIPHATFHELDKYVKDKMQGRGRGPWNNEIYSDTDRPAENGAGSGGSSKGKKRKHKSL